MARSTYIYIVVEVDYEGDNILAAFTVKHECQTWIERNPRDKLTRDVIRMYDGGSPSPDFQTRWAEGEFMSS
jgi:hypothetical protein